MKLKAQTKQFFKELLSQEDPKSARRFVTLVVTGLFIITCATILVLLVALFISIGRLQGMNIEALRIICSLLQDIITWEACITLGGLAFIGASDIVQIIKAKVVSIPPSQIPVADPTTNPNTVPVEQLVDDKITNS